MKALFKHVDFSLNYDIESTTDKKTGKRVYLTPEGNSFPSVTTVLGELKKDSILAWRKRVGEKEANKISTKASRRGTAVHTICEDYLNNKEDFLSNVLPMNIETFKSIQPILDNHINNVYAQEVGLYSNHLKLAGRVDCVAEFNGKLSIIDFKTSLKPKKREWIENYFMQEAAYAIMFEERTGIPINQLVTIIAVDDNSPQVFLESRNAWTPFLLNAIEDYQRKYG